MKYIRMFEDLDEDLYSEISRSDYYEEVGTDIRDLTPFTSREIKILNSIGFRDDRKDTDLLTSDKSLINKFFVYKERRTFNSAINLNLTKSDDEWYYIISESTTKYYKCDQFDGLLECLKKEFNIPKEGFLSKVKSRLRQMGRPTSESSIFESHDNIENLKEVKPNRFLYHTSNPIFRDKISKEGLIPKGKSDGWLSNTKIDGEVIFAVNSDNKKDWWDSTYDDDIYRIDTTNLNNKWYCDPNFDIENHRVITFEKIPSDSIRLIYTGR